MNSRTIDANYLEEQMMTPIDQIKAPASADEFSFFELAERAKAFLSAKQWCRSIREGYLSIGWEGILAVFFFEIEPAYEGVDDSIWVIVGDIPSAYLCNDNPNGASALDGYVYEMQRWVDAVRKGESVNHLIPVNVSPSRAYAEMLDSRLEFIRNRLLPEYADIITQEPVDD